MDGMTCECGWSVAILRFHPAVHLADHYTYDCPLRHKFITRSGKIRKRYRDG